VAWGYIHCICNGEVDFQDVLWTTFVITKFRSKELLLQKSNRLPSLWCPHPKTQPCYTLEHCFNIKSGPFIFKYLYLWGTSMWLKPNPYSTHVRTENLQTIWLFSQMLWNQGETINILAVAVRENIWDCRCILLCLVLVTKWGTSHRLDRKVNYRSWNSYMELSVVTKSDSNLPPKMLKWFLAAGYPQQALLWLKVATVRFFALNRSIVTDIIPATFLEPEWKISAFHSIKAVVSQVGALLNVS